MIPFVLRAAFAAFLLLAVHGQAAISIFPPGPTTDDEVTLRISSYCSNRVTSLTRSGNQIRVTLTHGGCPSPPVEWPLEVPLGELPPGQYDLSVQLYSDVPPQTMSFIVRPNAPRPFRLRPWAVATRPEGMRVHLDIDDPRELCGGVDCSTFRLVVAGKSYGRFDIQQPDGTFSFVPPDHAPGAVEVRVTNAQGTFVIPAGLVYFDPSAPPDVSVFERVLFPVLFSSGGANGSRWRSEVVLANPNPWAVQNWNDLGFMICVTSPCGERLYPKTRVSFEGERYPRGAALLVPRGESDDLSFSLRIRDVSRDAESYGSQVPVVREQKMIVNRAVTLLDVPLDPRFRTKVRLYAFLDPMYEETTNNSFANVRVGATGAPRRLQLVRSCTGDECAVTPYYAELDLAPGGEGTRADVYVELPEGALGWAFASVTNNITQQVTIVSPAGKGGRP